MVDLVGFGEPLHDPPEAKIDIVFVHGLNGDRVRTWTTEKTERNPVPVFWPKDLLKLKVPNARVLSFGYEAAVAHFYPLYGPKSVPPTATIHHHSAALLDNLAGLRNRTGTTDRPIIFVAHSLGGLVCADAVSTPMTGSDKDKEDVIDNVIGMLFLGTPFGFKRARWAALGRQLLKVFSETKEETIKDLEERSKTLVEINNRFVNFVKGRDRGGPPFLEIACYFEAYTTKIKGKSVGFIVDQEAATLNGITPLPIQEEHAYMCKFEDEFRSGFISITDKLRAWIDALDHEGDGEREPAGVSAGSVYFHSPITGNQGNIVGQINATKERAATLVGRQMVFNGDSWQDKVDQLPLA